MCPSKTVDKMNLLKLILKLMQETVRQLFMYANSKRNNVKWNCIIKLNVESIDILRYYPINFFKNIYIIHTSFKIHIIQ